MFFLFNKAPKGDFLFFPILLQIESWALLCVAYSLYCFCAADINSFATAIRVIFSSLTASDKLLLAVLKSSWAKRNSLFPFSTSSSNFFSFSSSLSFFCSTFLCSFLSSFSFFLFFLFLFFAASAFFCWMSLASAASSYCLAVYVLYGSLILAMTSFLDVPTLWVPPQLLAYSFILLRPIIASSDNKVLSDVTVFLLSDRLLSTAAFLF